MLKIFAGKEYSKNIRPRDFTEIAQSICSIYRYKKKLHNMTRENENDL